MPQRRPALILALAFFLLPAVASAQTWIQSWGALGTTPGLFQYPHSLAADATGVYVGDTVNSRIQKFSANGSYLGTIGGPGSGNGQFDFVDGVALGPGSVLYASDVGHSRLQKFTTAGAFVAQ